MAKIVNDVVETTQTTGTGTIDLAGAQTGHRAFADALADGEWTWYRIEDDPSSPSEVEVGYGRFNTGSPNTLTRDTVRFSTNGGSKISLQAGTSYTVTGVLPAEAVSRPVLAKTADYTATQADAGALIAVDASGAAVTVTLPPAAEADEMELAVKKTDSSGNAVTVDGSGAETIDGAATLDLTGQYDFTVLRCDGAAWHVVAEVDSDTTRDIATDAEAITGTNDTKAMSPAKVRTAGLSAAATELTIASGSITPAGRKHTVDTEGDAASDDLEVMPATNVSDGAVLLLRAENGARTVTVKHDTDSGATGNPKIFLADDADFALDDTEKSLLLELRGTEWHEIGRSVAGDSIDTLQLAQAWINFDGTGTISIRDSFNVASITDNGTGDYTITFDTALANANYAVVGAAQRGSTSDAATVAVTQGTTPSTTSVRVATWAVGSGGNEDCPRVMVAIFGGV